jgi:hypothetical protein
MSDIQCEKFTPRRLDPTTKVALWSADLTPAPSAEWEVVFKQELATHATVTGFPVANLRIHRLKGRGILEFDSAEPAAQAAAQQIHRAVEKTNTLMAEQQAEQKRQSDAEQKKRDESGDELKRLQEKYPRGI